MNRIIFGAGMLVLLTVYCTAAQAADRKKGDGDITYKEIKEISIDNTSLDEAQNVCVDVVSSIDEAAVDTAEKKAPPKYWTNGILTQVGFSQVSLTNWAEGGSANVSLNALIDANANYAKDKMIWENRLKLSYGFIQSFDKNTPLNQQFDKSDDRIYLDSKWGWQLVDKLYFSALLNFRTQFSPTYEFVPNESTGMMDRNTLSNFMSPGYLSLGVGINYKPFNFLSLNLSPATGNMVVVTDPKLWKTYGNDKAVRAEFGAQFKMDINYSYKIFKVSSALTLFSNYLENPQNIQVYWDVDASLALTKILTLTLRTNLIWDENILIKDAAGVEAPRLQFKEIVSLGLTWTFGQYVKPE
ncbi:MAG TPA: DUF3078 domain-containing protein [Candidatus Coprenecus stercoravium]|uniref:DUF3078 domain-containing protein n=1 Tax=Candidatus Coprenecus stercoravium TaxID=2840735 RepID=A0A9D2KA98_9BACT|nr:DUF3078 domain-containing protein [Candidatus Coprenecus stercoravium]